MANVDSPKGLIPVRHRSGAPWNGLTVPCYIDSGYGTALYVGDPVVKVAGGSNAAAVKVPGAGSFPIGTLPSIEKAAAGDANRVSGVIVGFAPLPTDLSKNYNPASTARVAYVCMDPDVVFEIQADGAIPAASVGLNGVFIYTHSGSTTTGLSGVELDTTSDVPAADASNQMLILRAVNREDNDTTSTWAKVEVLIICHTEAHGSTAAGDGILGI
jgi:hypothetical protein